MISAIVSATFSFFGIIGALAEHYWFTVTFTVYISFSSIVGFIIGIRTRNLHLSEFLSVVISALISCLAISFVMLLKKERNSNASQPPNEIIFGPMITIDNEQQMQATEPPPYKHEYQFKTYP